MTAIVPIGVPLGSYYDPRIVVPSGIAYDQSFWTSQTQWSVDPSNKTKLASDGNLGCGPNSDNFPLLTWRQLLRRWTASDHRTLIPQNTVIRVLSDVTAAETWMDFGGLYGNPRTTSLGIQGIPTVIHSGTLSAVTNAPWSVTDSALPDSWTNLDCISGPNGTRLMRKTTGNVHAPMEVDLGAGVAQIGLVNNVSEALIFSNAAITAFSPGDQYEVISLPKIPNIFHGGQIQIFALLVDFGAPGDVTSEFWESSCYARLCGFRHNLVRWGGSIYNLGAASGCYCGNQSGTAAVLIPRLGSFGANSFAPLTQISGFTGDNNSLTNEWRKQLILRHSTYGRIGTINLYGQAGVAIQVDNTTQVMVDGIHGSGNLGLIAFVRDSGCQIQVQGTMDAATSAPLPLGVAAQTFSYADAVAGIANIPSRAMGFY